MVLRVALSVTDCEDREVLEPQVLVESGKVASINVAYKLMNILSAKNAEDVINFADKTRAITTFVVEYFSLKGTRSVQSKYEFLFRVSDTYINTKIVDHKA
jgi:arginine decarboxylase-like protein